IRTLAAGNKRRRYRFNDAAPMDNSGLNYSKSDFLPEGATSRNSRTVKKLLFAVGPINSAAGERVVMEQNEDGMVGIYIIHPSVDLIGETDAGDRWNPGNAVGDQEPNANERMYTHTIEYSGGGRKDPLLIHMNALHNGLYSMAM